MFEIAFILFLVYLVGVVFALIIQVMLTQEGIMLSPRDFVIGGLGSWVTIYVLSKTVL